MVGAGFGAPPALAMGTVGLGAGEVGGWVAAGGGPGGPPTALPSGVVGGIATAGALAAGANGVVGFGGPAGAAGAAGFGGAVAAGGAAGGAEGGAVGGAAGTVAAGGAGAGWAAGVAGAGVGMETGWVGGFGIGTLLVPCTGTLLVLCRSAEGTAGGASAALSVTRTVSFIRGMFVVFLDNGIFDVWLERGTREDCFDGWSSGFSFSLMRWVKVGVKQLSGFPRRLSNIQKREIR